MVRPVKDLSALHAGDRQDYSFFSSVVVVVGSALGASSFFSGFDSLGEASVEHSLALFCSQKQRFFCGTTLN